MSRLCLGIVSERGMSDIRGYIPVVESRGPLR